MISDLGGVVEPQPVEHLATFLERALAQPSPVLFAGAGVSCRAGFPDWSGYLEHLAKACESNGEGLTAQLIRERAAVGRYLEAAAAFKTAVGIPEGERWKLLAEPFRRNVSEAESGRLKPLAQLEFSAIVTTNFDSVLHTARAQCHGWFRPIELDDDSIRGASLISDFFIARIHGRAELPQTIVIDSYDYQRLQSNSSYLDFVLDLLRLRQCLFIGFSFLDPAIEQVLKLYEEKFGPTYQQLHSAMIPAEAEGLQQALRSLNIDVALYDSSNRHRDLWRAVRMVFDRRQSMDSPKLEPDPSSVTTGLDRLMAFAYAQVTSAHESRSITRLVQDGIVASQIDFDDGTTISNIYGSVESALRLSSTEAAQVVEESLGRLLAKGVIRRDGDQFLLTSRDDETTLDRDLTSLADAVVDRILVRGSERQVWDHGIIKTLLERMFLARAWDLAAHYAGADSGWGKDLSKVAGRILGELATDLSSSEQRDLRDAVLSLLTAPEDRQSGVLARVGRAAFGVQLVVSTPRQALIQEHSLPEQIYLDSNVLLPAITRGHPLRGVYIEALRRLAEAGSVAKVELAILVGEEILNEVVSHRHLAIEMVRLHGLGARERLLDHIRFYGALNTNVFVSAYGAAVEASDDVGSFEEFLDEYAPYSDENELKDLLRSQGIGTVSLWMDGAEHSEFSQILSRLRDGYARITPLSVEPKKGILVEHEAQQLAQLRIDAQQGIRSVFVTADGRLRRIMAEDEQLHDVGAACVSHAGLVAMVEVMVGLGPENESVVRLMWAHTHSDSEQALFDFFVACGLRRYEEGMALEMQEAARVVASEAAEEAQRTKRDLFGSDDPANTAFLERYEDRFFEFWREAIEKRMAELQ